MSDPRRQLLEDAANLVTGDRAQVYGPPQVNFSRTSDLWVPYLAAIGRPRLEPHDVAILNILQKISRLVQSPSHHDSWLDICGFSAAGWACVAPQADR
jgi:hypothetical protein